MPTRGHNIDRRLHVTAVLLIAGSLTLPARTEQAAAPPSQEALARVDGIVERERAKAKIPGLNVAIALGGRLVYEKGFGLADVENKVPATHETRFRTASIAKPITATAVMQLVERGAIDLDAPIQQYCPAFPQKPWPITARMILGHLAGIRHYTKRGESAGTEHFFGIADSLKLFKDDPLLHEPGTKYEYSTYGYSVLGCAVESAAKMTYAEYLRRNVFEPAGMTKTTIDEHYLILPNRARGYQLLTKEGFDSLPPAAKAIAKPDEVYNAVLHDTSMKTPGGGLLSTASDLVRFASAVRDGKLLKRESVQAMWTSQKTRGGEETRYGLGWGVRVTDGRLTGVFHSGNQAGASSNLRLAPADGGAIAIMTNLEDAELGPILNAIAAEVRAEFQLDGRATGAIRFEPYPLKLDDGTTVEAERGRLTVPENRARPGRTIELVFVRLRSTAARAGDPIVYLAGGPGDSGTSAARVPRLGTLFQRMRTIADVILLDQRATGQSTPSLFCPADGPLAADALESAAAMRAALEPR
ncbi:MAG: serine hydrolase domain-containing protein, partial [Vicinamibacterales bacterium]